MLAYLDPILFPDDIRLIETLSGDYIYPIFKNGSRSLENSGLKILSIEEFTKVSHVNVYVRDPFERFVTGVRSFIRLNPSLDKDTVVKMINELLFLNGHFSLQFHWIVNLVRHVDPLITLHPLSELSKVTPMFLKSQYSEEEMDQDLVSIFKENQKLQFYLKLDKVLTEVFINKTVKFSDIVAYIKTNESDLYQEVLQRSKDLCSVLD